MFTIIPLLFSSTSNLPSSLNNISKSNTPPSVRWLVRRRLLGPARGLSLRVDRSNSWYLPDQFRPV